MGDVYSKAPVVTIGIHYIYYGQPKVKTLIFLSTYISTYIHNHTNIRMDVANHIVDAHSYAPVLSYGDGEASFIHEVLITQLNLESPCVAILCRQQNITRPQCFDICLLCFAFVVATFILGNSLMCFKQSHLCRLLCLRSGMVVTLCKNCMYPNSMPRHMKILNCVLRPSHSSILYNYYNSGLNMFESNSLLQTLHFRSSGILYSHIK